MNIVNKMFDYLTGEGRRSVLSMRFFQYLHQKSEQRWDNWVSSLEDTEKVSSFNLAGGIKPLIISDEPNHYCGKHTGFGFYVYDPIHGFGSCVLHREEAKKLATFLLSQLDAAEQTEEEIIESFKSDRNDYREYQRLKAKFEGK